MRSNTIELQKTYPAGTTPGGDVWVSLTVTNRKVPYFEVHVSRLRVGGYSVRSYSYPTFGDALRDFYLTINELMPDSHKEYRISRDAIRQTTGN